MNRLGAMANASLHLVYSYSHKDERMLNRLRTHLAVLRRHEGMTEWYDRDIEAGAKWRQEIAEQLNLADLILLLVSADYLASDFCYEEEMRRAIERSDRRLLKNGLVRENFPRSRNAARGRLQPMLVSNHPPRCGSKRS